MQAPPPVYDVSIYLHWMQLNCPPKDWTRDIRTKDWSELGGLPMKGYIEGFNEMSFGFIAQKLF